MAGHSKTRQTWETKLSRIGALAKRDTQTIFNNVGHVMDHEMLCAMHRRLEGNKAAGVDRMTKKRYGERLNDRIQRLLAQIRQGAYRPQPVRVVEIPKEGKKEKRPLSIASYEDKIVQRAVQEILTQIYEPMFLPISYGGRPGKSAHEALRSLMWACNATWQGAMVEIDLQQCFCSIPHEELMRMLRERIRDRRLLRLIERLLKVPTEQDGHKERRNRGCPQGSILSPLLANIYLHHVVDAWFERIRQRYFVGEVQMVRYLDDMVFVFSDERDASRFYEVLPKRLGKYGLTLHVEKSSKLKCGRGHAREEARRGRRMQTFNFLGFTAYWGLSRNRKQWRLKYTTRKDRFSNTLKAMKEALRERSTWKTSEVLRWYKSVVRGWLNYHGISDNDRRPRAFIMQASRLLFRWYNRRGGKKPMNWKRFSQILKQMDFPERWKTVSMFTSAPKVV